MSTIPSFKLYDSTGVSLIYTFLAVYETNAPQSPKRNIVISGQRASGCIIIPAGNKEWDLSLKGTLYGADYDAVSDLMYAMQNTIVINTAYVLKFARNSTQFYSYNVKRIDDIEWETGSLRNYVQKYTCIFKAGSW